MRVLYTIAAVIAWTLGAATARADGLLYQLPKDGTWAKYDAAFSIEHDQMGKTMLGKGSLRMASVGQVTEEGQPCRWIEVAVEMRSEAREDLKIPEGEYKEVWKVLVPEKYLAKGETPLNHAIRAWMADFARDAPKKPSGPDTVPKARQWLDVEKLREGPLPMALAGPPKGVSKLDKAEVESKLGKLTCEGVRGVLEFNDPIAMIRSTTTIETRLHAKAPFGVVSSRWTIEETWKAETKPDHGMKMVWDFKLVDLGDGAKSELPDAK